MYGNVFVLAQLMLQYDMHRFNKYNRDKKKNTLKGRIDLLVNYYFNDAKGFMIFFTLHVVFPGQFIIYE